jgi:hypothetical protein
MLVTPAACPLSALVDWHLGSFVRERNQNLAFSATWHPMYKPDIWD